VYYNPAGLVFLEQRWATATVNSMALDRKLFFLGYAQSIGRDSEKNTLKGGFALGWMAAGVDGIDARDQSGNDIGTLSNWEHCFFFSFALNPAPPVAIGVSGKLLTSRMPDLMDDGGALSAVGFGFDIGVLVRPWRTLTLGLTVRDLRSKYTWDTQELYERGTQTVNRFPTIVRGGAAFRFQQDRVLVSFDVEKIQDRPAIPVAGIQFEGVRDVFLRAGMRKTDPTFGLGYIWSIGAKSIHLDYSFVPDPIAPRETHVMTWSLAF